MARYLLRKIPSILFVLVISSIIAFVLPRLAPGDPAQSIAGTDASPEQVEAVRRATGLDQPLITQYLNWVGGLFHGDLGRSYILRQPVADLIAARVGSTLSLALFAALLMIVIALVLGVLGGSKRSKTGRTVLDVVNTVLLATPPFLIGLLLILAFGVAWRILPVSGEVSLFTDPQIGIQYLILPALALALSQAAVVARLLQTSMLTVRGEEFVDLARAKGASPRRVTFRHVLRNSMGAAIVAVGIRIGELLGGAIIIEAIFARSGLGQLAVQAVNTRDYFVIQVLIIGAVFIAVLSQLATDIILASIDPRVRLDA